MPYDKLKQEHYRNLGGINTHESKYQTGETKFLDLRNFGFERPGALISRPGIEHHLTLSFATASNTPRSLFQYTKNSGASYLIADNFSTLMASPVGGSFVGIWPGLTHTVGSSPVPFDFVVSRDMLYAANGRYFVRFNGSVAINYNLPEPFPITPILEVVGGLTFNTALTDGSTQIIASGTWSIAYCEVRGYTTAYDQPSYGFSLSIFSKMGTPNLATNFLRAFANVGATVVSRGRWQLCNITVQPFYGISAVSGYLNGPPFGTTIFYSLTTAPLYATNAAVFAEFDHTTASVPIDDSRVSFSAIPRFLELFNNRLIMAGSSSAPSTIYYSEPGDPENVQPDNFFEVRTGDGDDIQGLAVFQDALLAMKKNSIFEFSGTAPENFQLRELTNEYGIVNDRAWVVFENNFWFMDRSGIIQYDGSNFKRVSEPVASILATMDIFKAYAVHIKKRREVWFCASETCVVWNYDVQAWTCYDRLGISAETGPALINYGSTRTDLSYWRQGASFQELVRFNDSVFTDLGSDVTLIHQTRFHKRLENTTQELWRQLFFNYAVPGATQSVTLQLIPDYGSSIYAERSSYLDAFQKRVQFGISSRSLSVKSILKSSQQIRFNGYALESRFLRRV